MMKTTMFAAMATVLFPAWFASAPTVPAEEGHHADVRDIVGAAKISLRDAIAKALAAQPGRAVEADLEGEFEGEKLDVFFEVMVLTAGNELVQVTLDPQTGAVREREEADEDAHEIPGFQAALRHSERDLGQLVQAAESFVKGTAVSASLEYEGGMPVCDIAIVNTRCVIDVEIEGRAGHLIEVELRREAVEREHDEEAVEREHDEEGEHAEKGEEHEHAEKEEGHEGKKQGGEEEEEEEEEGEARPAPKPAVRVRKVG
ncbi:MAG: PepSY domain-containing protein [Planctomycetes bacterium]|nr:PepSY domain-containing protein [Planctomycetota bacterium]